MSKEVDREIARHLARYLMTTDDLDEEARRDKLPKGREGSPDTKLKDIIGGVRLAINRISQIPIKNIKRLEETIINVLMELFGTDIGGFFRVIYDEDETKLETRVFKHPASTHDTNIDLTALDFVISKGKFAEEEIVGYIDNVWKFLKSEKDAIETPTPGIGIDLWLKIRDRKGKPIAVLFFDHSQKEHRVAKKDQIIFYAIAPILKKYADALEFKKLREIERQKVNAILGQHESNRQE